MTNLQIFNLVKRILFENFDIVSEEVEYNTKFKTLGIIESELEEFIMDIEDRFEIEIPESDYKIFKAVSTLVEYLERFIGDD